MLAAASKSLFPAGVRLLALPNQKRPRIIIASESAWQRWKHSQAFPAYRVDAKAYRLAVRAVAFLGIGGSALSDGHEWPLAEFLNGCLPGMDAVVVMVGTSGPTQKLTIQVWSEDRIVGYVKYAELPAAIDRLKHEVEVLSCIPSGTGPGLVIHGSFRHGYAMVTRPVGGRTLSPNSTHLGRAARFLKKLERTPPLALDRHPWVLGLRDQHGPVVDVLLEPLATSDWPLVYQHGDFAPWNVLGTSDGDVIAVDWEHGTVDGFPYLDATHWVLQVAALMKRWPPRRANAFAIRTLEPHLSTSQAVAITRLASYSAYQAALADGHSAEEPLQQWRRAVWEGW